MRELKTKIYDSLLIDGIWQKPAAMSTITVLNPSTGDPLSEIGYGSSEDAQYAMNAASKAFLSWSVLPARDRADYLLKTASLIRERAQFIGYVLAMESGKRVSEAESEVRFAAEYFQWFAEEIRRPFGAFVPGDVKGRYQMVLQQAAGVAISLTPWNFPVSIQARKLAPALASGCTVVARPSQRAPLAVIELIRCLTDAGIPAGVINLVIGSAVDTTATMLDHPALRVVSFTGSTAVGQELVRLSANQLPKMALELGGNAPFIVFADADIEKAIEGALIAKFRNNGQSCVAANRFYIQDDIYDHFLTRLSQRVEAMRIGNPISSAGVDVGPVINEDNSRRLKDLVNSIKTAGGSTIVRDMELPNEGFYVAPQFLENVSHDSTLFTEEVFGPIAGVHRFHDEDEVISYANDTDMGLAGYIFTSDLNRAVRVSSAVECGIIGLNHALPSISTAPMGGMKKSGIGREGGRAGLDEFMEIKYISMQQ